MTTAVPTVRPYAGFWRRFAALMIDTLVVIGVAMAAGFVLGLMGANLESRSTDVGLRLGIVLFGWLYYALMESSPSQATLGKQALGIKVTDREGAPVSFGRATGRFFAKILSGIPFSLGYLLAAFTPRKQALHDMVAGCLVIKRSTDAETLRAAPAAASANTAAIVVAVVIAGGIFFVGGILAAIAIPAYQDYTIRSQVADGLAQAGVLKAAVAEYAFAHDQWPQGLADLELAQPAQSLYVEAYEIDDGAIVIRYAGHANIAGLRLALTPSISQEGDIYWQCRGIDLPQRHLPSNCRDPNASR